MIIIRDHNPPCSLHRLDGLIARAPQSVEGDIGRQKMACLRWAIALTCILAGCASVKVVRVDPSKVDAAYNDPQRIETSGVLFYRPRPYLMVTEAPPPKDQQGAGGT